MIVGTMREHDISVLIRKAAETLKLVEQWRRMAFDGPKSSIVNVDSLENCLKYAHEAEGLVKLVEVQVCGSVGGHYYNKHGGSRDLIERLEWATEELLGRTLDDAVQVPTT